MGYFIGFFIIFLLTISVLLLFPIRICISYVKNEDNSISTADIKYMFFKFRIYPNGKPKKQKEKTEKTKMSFEERKTVLGQYIEIFKAIRYDIIKILDYANSKALVIEKIGVNIDFGFEDAMHTGIFTGLLNGFVYNILGVIHHQAKLEEMDVNIRPVFGNPCYKTHIECIFRLKNVHIIIVAVNVLKLLRKMKKIKGGR